MSHRRTGVALFLLMTAGLGWSLVNAETQPPKKSPAAVPEAALMRAKTASLHKVAGGLVARDFTEIRSGAEEIIRICRATEWKAHEDAVYGHHRSELIRQATKLMDASERMDGDSATFAYINTLTTCINCHDHSREVLKIATVKPRSKVVPIPTDDTGDVSDRPTRR